KSHRVVGTLESAANTTYTIEIFARRETDTGDDGQKFVVSANVKTNASGIAFFDIPLPDGTEIPGADVTQLFATATDENGNTSEFSDLVVDILEDSDGDGIPDALEGAGPDKDGSVATVQDAIDTNSSVTLTAIGGKTLTNVRPLEN